MCFILGDFLGKGFIKIMFRCIAGMSVFNEIVEMLLNANLL
jgi:hypothetical protein